MSTFNYTQYFIPTFCLENTWDGLVSFSDLARYSAYRSVLSNSTWLPGDTCVL